MLINGIEANSINPLDRGFHYGDGLFETVAVKNGELQLWDQHMQRLADGCRRLGLPEVDPSLLYSEAARLFADKSSHDQAILKIILSRGVGGRGYRPPKRPAITRVLLRYPWPYFPERYHREGVRVLLCETRLGCNPALAGIKHLNRLEQVIASCEWSEPDVQEGIMLDQHGWVIEGTRSNIFIVRNGRLFTPDLSQCGVAGVIRKEVIDLAGKSGIVTETGNLSQKMLQDADEIFLCNSVIGIWPVKSLENRVYDGHIVTKELQKLLQQHLAENGMKL